MRYGWIQSIVDFKVQIDLLCVFLMSKIGLFLRWLLNQYVVHIFKLTNWLGIISCYPFSIFTVGFIFRFDQKAFKLKNGSYSRCSWGIAQFWNKILTIYHLLIFLILVWLRFLLENCGISRNFFLTKVLKMDFTQVLNHLLISLNLDFSDLIWHSHAKNFCSFIDQTVLESPQNLQKECPTKEIFWTL